VTSSEDVAPVLTTEVATEDETAASPLDNGMQDYYNLQRELFLLTVGASLVAFGFVWWFYTFDTASSYLLGAATGVMYLRMLSKKVEGIGANGNQSLGTGRFALLIILIFVASRWNQLELVPVFLGFLTYKIALIFYTLRVALVR
jgi:ATP synthase protein I